MSIKGLAFAFGLLPFVLSAGGFQVNLQGNKQAGMGHLGTSFYLGASSTFFNPAMMGLDTNKFSFELGGSLIFSEITFQNRETGLTERADNDVSTPFYFYGTYKINDKFSAGLGVYTPYGSAVKWDDDWSGKNLIQEISLRAIYVQPTLSYQVNEKLAIGGGLTAVFGSFEIDRAVPAPIGENNTTHLEGDETGFGFNAGVHYQATEKLSIGLTYRSKVDIELEDGDASFNMDPAIASGFPDGQFAADLPLVATSTLGLAYQANEKWLFSVEGSFIEWSDYETLDFDFETNTSSLEDSQNPRKYDDAIILRVGAQYSMSEKVILRAGFYYDESPIQDDYLNPETVSSNNWVGTGGLTYQPNHSFSLDLSLIAIKGEERTSQYKPANFGGVYETFALIPGIGFNYTF